MSSVSVKTQLVIYKLVISSILPVKISINQKQIQQLLNLSDVLAVILFDQFSKQTKKDRWDVGYVCVCVCVSLCDSDGDGGDVCMSLYA